MVTNSDAVGMPGEDDLIKAVNLINEGLALMLKVLGPRLPITTLKVEPGQTLWDLARRTLGYGQRYRELFFMNYPTFSRFGIYHPGGITPDLIYPGEELIVLQG